LLQRLEVGMPLLLLLLLLLLGCCAALLWLQHMLERRLRRQLRFSACTCGAVCPRNGCCAACMHLRRLLLLLLLAQPLLLLMQGLRECREVGLGCTQGRRRHASC
jgi:ABC-type Fe3+ transport system permease subunit